jgi:hypothetical protein
MTTAASSVVTDVVDVCRPDIRILDDRMLSGGQQFDRPRR